MVLILSGDLESLADTTVILLLGVFVIVNITVLVLRRDRVEHEHFTAPTVVPVLGGAGGAVPAATTSSPTTARCSCARCCCWRWAPCCGW